MDPNDLVIIPFHQDPNTLEYISCRVKEIPIGSSRYLDRVDVLCVSKSGNLSWHVDIDAITATRALPRKEVDVVIIVERGGIELVLPASGRWHKISLDEMHETHRRFERCSDITVVSQHLLRPDPS